MDDISVDTRDGDRSYASHGYDDESINSQDETDIYGNPMHQHDDDEASEADGEGGQNEGVPAESDTGLVAQS